MAYSFNNGFCHQCDEFVPAGPDTSIRLWTDGDWQTFCTPCGIARQTNKKKAADKRAYIKAQPTLLDEIAKEEKKGGEIVRKFKFITGTGEGNHILVTEKTSYTWLEFSNEEDCQRFVRNQPNAEFRGGKTTKGTIKTYQVIVRK